jgi:alanine racemase
MNYRPTKIEIDLNNIRDNVKTIIKTYPEYEYYFGVVKADSYGFRGNEVVKSIIDGGCNYLCVSFIEDALKIREDFKEIPILVFVPQDVPQEILQICKENDIALTITSFDDFENYKNYKDLKVFIRLNGGNDIFNGAKTKSEFDKLVNNIENSNLLLEGIYLHNYEPESVTETETEYTNFEILTDGILDKFKIVNISNSLSIPRYPKKSYANGCRIGNIIYGIENDSLELKNCFNLQSQIQKVFTLKKGEKISYSKYCSVEDEKLAIIPIGYGDGFSKINLGRTV